MKRSLLALVAAVATLLSSSALQAEVTLPAIFTSHMVLQRDMANPIWGKAAPGEEVTVAIGDQAQTAKAGDEDPFAWTRAIIGQQSQGYGAYGYPPAQPASPYGRPY